MLKILEEISRSKYPLPKPQEIGALMQGFLAKIPEWRKVKHPAEAAALVHKEFVIIHPFVDGNGRVARLIMNLFLLQEGFNIAIIPPSIRAEYIAALEKSHYDDRDFIHLIARMV
ncbi:MAG: Fic family protein [Chlamydiae bacterium]|nr:Fic family protein [Chlamydiota bacterium]